MLKLVLALGLACVATPTLAQAVVETDFQVTVTDSAGQQTVDSTNVVPLRNGACYDWWVRFDKSKGDVTITEIFTLPTAPASWGTVNETMTISDDSRTATSTLVRTPTEGWIGHGWCVAKGDPPGEHLIEVMLDGRLLASFPFVVE